MMNRRNTRAHLHELVGSLLLYTLLAIVLLWPAVESCAAVFPGPIGDGTSGLLWRIWASEAAGGTPFDAWTVMANYPVGEPFWTPAAMQSTFIVALQWIFSLVVGAICSYTIVAIVGIVFSSMSTYVLARSYAGTGFFTVLSGVGVGLGAFVTYKVQDHVQWTYVGIVCLALLSAKRLIESPVLTRALVSAAVVGSSFYIDWYLAYATVAATTAFCVVSLIINVQPLNRVRVVRTALTALSVVIVMLLPQVWAQITNMENGRVGLMARPFEELVSGSATLDQLLTPGVWYWLPYRGVLPWLPGDFSAIGLPSSDLHEVFLGFFTILGIFALLISSRRLPPTITWRALLPLIGVAATGLMLSIPPYIDIWGLRIPTATRLIFEFLPQVRAVSRLAMITLVASTILAAVGWFALSNRTVSRSGRLAICLLALACVAVDVGFPFLRRPPFTNFSEPPAPYAWLAARAHERERQSVVELVNPDDVDARYSSWQLVHNLPLVNDHMLAYEPNSTADLLYETFVHPQAACIMNSLGVDYALHHWTGPSLKPSSLTPLLAAFRSTGEGEHDAFWNNVDIYGVASKDLQADSALVYGPGFLPGTWDGQRGVAVTQGLESFLRVLALGPQFIPSQMNLDARTDLSVERVVLSQGGKILWEGEIGQDWQRVSFEAPPGLIKIHRQAATGDSPKQNLWVGRLGSGDCT